MKVIWRISGGKEECPRCDSVLITFNGKDQICPSCAAREIKRLQSIERAAREILPHVTERGMEGETEWERLVSKLAALLKQK